MKVLIYVSAPETCAFQEDSGGSYRGTVNFTRGGPCRSWRNDNDYLYTPMEYVLEENYCRNEADSETLFQIDEM